MNKHRGEIEISLGGRTYLLRPTFEAICEFEERAGKSAYEAVQAVIANQSAPMKAVAAAFYSGIKAAWPERSGHPTFAEIGELVRNTGLPKVLPDYVQFLTNALTSATDLERSAEDEAKGKDQGASPTR